MRNEDRQPHIREMKAITHRDKRQGHNMMRHQLVIILPRLLQAQNKNDSLLQPVCSLEQVIKFEMRIVCVVRRVLIHASCVEVPDRRPAHDIQSPWSCEGKVDGSIHLLHEARLLRPTLQAASSRQWT